MVIVALVILLFLLGFGSMIISHAHKEFHVIPRRVQMSTGLFIIFFTTVLILYLSGYLFSRTIFLGERPFEVGMGPLKTWVASIEKNASRNSVIEESLVSLNTILQKQALQTANIQKTKLESQVASLKKEVKSLKTTASPVKRTFKRVTSNSRRTSYINEAKSAVASKPSSPKVIYNLVGYDSSKYTPATEPVLYVAPVATAK